MAVQKEHTSRTSRLNAWGRPIAVGALLLLGWGTARPDELPPDVAETWRVLNKTFVGMKGALGSGSRMRKDVMRHGGAITSILGWAKTSDGNAILLADHVLGLLDRFSARFAPGTAIDPDVLGARNVLRGSEPQYGIVTGTHILLELARHKRLPAGARATLVAACSAFAAEAYLGERRSLFRGSLSAASVEREKRENGGYLTTWGAELAWVCDRFMLSEAGSSRPILPDPALGVAREYAG